MNAMLRGMLLFFLVAFIGCGSVQIAGDTRIIELPGQGKAQIYQKAMQWIKIEFSQGQVTINNENKNTGKISATGLIFLDTVLGSHRSVFLTVDIDCISGKTKIKIAPKLCRVSTLQGGNIDGPCDNFSMNLMSSALKYIPEKINKSIENYRAYMTGGRAPAWDGR